MEDNFPVRAEMNRRQSFNSLSLPTEPLNLKSQSCSAWNALVHPGEPITVLLRVAAAVLVSSDLNEVCPLLTLLSTSSLLRASALKNCVVNAPAPLYLFVVGSHSAPRLIDLSERNDVRTLQSQPSKIRNRLWSFLQDKYRIALICEVCHLSSDPSSVFCSITLTPMKAI